MGKLISKVLVNANCGSVNAGNGITHIKNNLQDAIDDLEKRIELLESPSKLRKAKLEEIFGFEKKYNTNMLDYLKEEIIRVSEKHFKRTDPSGMLNHLKLEVQELSEAIGKDNEEEEWADCVLLLLDAFRVRYGDDVSFNKLLHFALNKLDKVDKRNWSEQPDENGIFHKKN
jgi:hypothetical protein